MDMVRVGWLCEAISDRAVYEAAGDFVIALRAVWSIYHFGESIKKSFACGDGKIVPSDRKTG